MARSKCNAAAIHLGGDNLAVRRCLVKNYGSPYDQECGENFAVSMWQANETDGEDMVAEDCVFTGMSPLSPCGCSVLTISGGPSKSDIQLPNWTRGAVARRNHFMGYHPGCHGITMSGCQGCIVEDNYFEHFMGCGIYTDTWPMRDIILQSNIMTDINQGIFLAANQPTVPTPQQYVQSGLNVNLLDYRNWSTGTRIAQPYSLQYTFGLERQLREHYVVKLFYIATRGVKLMREQETNYGFLKSAVDANPSTYASVLPNLKLVSSIPAPQSINSPVYRVDPTIGGRGVGSGIAMSTYNSLQATLEKRFANGLQFQANYTWSSFIDDADDILGGANNSTIPAVPFNYKLDKGRSGLDQPQRLVVNYVYQFQFLKEQRGVLGRALGGWELAGITTEASGTPYTIFNSYNALGTIASSQLTLQGATQRVSINPNGVPGTAPGTGVTNPYYIPNPTNSGIIGTLGRNTQRAGGTNNFNVSAQKDIRLTGERHHLQFRWELFDLMKHRNFTTIPAYTVTNSTNAATFLNLGQTNVAGRSMQFLLRYSF